MRRFREHFEPVGCTRAELHAEYAHLLSGVAWSYMVTLTLNPQIYRRTGPESWLRAWRWFLWAWMAESAVLAGRAEKRPCGEDRDGKPRFNVRGPWASGMRKGRGWPMWVLATEHHRDDRMHAHALVATSVQLPRYDFAAGHRIWKEGRQSIMWIESPRSQARVCEYVSKYVVKSGPDGLTFSESFDAARLPLAFHSGGGVSQRELEVQPDSAV